MVLKSYKPFSTDELTALAASEAWQDMLEQCRRANVLAEACLAWQKVQEMPPAIEVALDLYLGDSE